MDFFPLFVDWGNDRSVSEQRLTDGCTHAHLMVTCRLIKKTSTKVHIVECRHCKKRWGSQAVIRQVNGASGDV